MPHAPDLSGCALDDRYELHAVIGEGAFGRVYRGVDRRLARQVAVKVIKPWWTEDPEWVHAFEREAQLLARVSDPGIVQIFDVGHADEGLYYVAELVEGESLADRLRRGPLPPWQACGVAAQLCRALARAHGERIVHRDVKPANILLSADGRVKVGDFGVARLAQGTNDAGDGSIVGTPQYMAPEQGRGARPTPATDVYSVGVVLYEMLCGRPPFSGGTVVELALRHLHDPAPPLPDHTPPALAAIAERALAKDPAQRYADGAAMAEALVDARRRSPVGRRARFAPTPVRSGVHAAPPGTVVGAAARLGEAPRRHGAPRHAGAPPATGPPPAAGPPHRPGAAPPPPDHPSPDHAPPDHARPGHPDHPDHPHGDQPQTRRAPQLSPRRNVNPPARRRAAAAIAAVLALAGAMLVAGLLLQPSARTRVPRLVGLTRQAALAAARTHRLRPRFSARYDAAVPAGRVLAQAPAQRARVPYGSRVALVVSRGPAPVNVPRVTNETLADAQQSLRSLGFRTRVHSVPAPAVAPGTVTGQSPGTGPQPFGTTIALSVAEVPRWRTVTTFHSLSSGAVHIIGRRWRVVYRMAFQGTCTWIFWCSGPTARVANAGDGAQIGAFGLQDGDERVQSFATGAGTYELRITPGGDDATWTASVQDYY